MLTPSLFWVTILSISTVLSFSACGKKQASFDSIISKPARVSTGYTGTKHFDIPTPLTFTSIATSNQASPGIHDCFRFGGTLPLEQTIAFYKREMERNGWDITDLSDKHEGFLYCTKPTKTCGISIRNQKTGTQPILVALFVRQEA